MDNKKRDEIVLGTTARILSANRRRDGFSRAARSIVAAALDEYAEALRDDAARMERVTQFLWKLLDDIDTLDDACKDNDRSFRDLTRKRQKMRWRTGASCDGYAVDLSTADVAAQTGVEKEEKGDKIMTECDCCDNKVWMPEVAYTALMDALPRPIQCDRCHDGIMVPTGPKAEEDSR